MVRSVPAYFEDTFKVTNDGTGIVVELGQYLVGNYFLPQGALLARMLINGRLVVDGLSVVDYSLPQIGKNQHRWEVNFDIGSAELVKLSDSHPILVNLIEIQFYVNEDGLRSVEIEERDRANAFDFFKQDVADTAWKRSFRSFWFYPFVRHDFTDNKPFVIDFISNIVESSASESDHSYGLRFEITPLFQPSDFIFERLYKVRVYRVEYDYDGAPLESKAPLDFVGELKVSGEQVAVNYKTGVSKEGSSLGPFFKPGPYVQKNGGEVGDLPFTRFLNHQLSVDPLGAKGLLFLEPAAVKTEWSASIAANDWLMRFSLSSYFSVTRDLAAELFVLSKSDFSIISIFHSADAK